jgi:DNA-binding MarR family transcriptional regulator
MQDSPALDALISLSRATASANLALDKTLSRVGLWLKDLSLLMFLVDGPLTRAELAGSLKTSQSETVRRVKPMEKLNWIERDTDGRFALTAVGAALVDEAGGLAANRAEVWLGELLSDEDVLVLSSLLGKLV